MRTKLFAAVAALAIATPALAEPLQSNVVSRQLAQADSLVQQSAGAYSIVTTLQANLDDGEDRTDSVTLSRGGDYVIIGVCDNDCSDFDLSVTDADGDDAGSDLEMDDIPMVRINGAYGGRYRIQSMMADCSVEPCATAVRVYRID